MHSTTRTSTTFELELGDRFVWSKTGGRFEGREFIATELEVETSTDPNFCSTLRIRGPWLTPLNDLENEHLRVNGWETFLERYDVEQALKLPEVVLEVAASAGFVVPVSSR